MTIQTSDPKCLDAWVESYWIVPLERSDHSTSAALQFLPWIMAKLWNVHVYGGSMVTSPIRFGERTPPTATIITPQGEMPVTLPA